MQPTTTEDGGGAVGQIGGVPIDSQGMAITAPEPDNTSAAVPEAEAKEKEKSEPSTEPASTLPNEGAEPKAPAPAADDTAQATADELNNFAKSKGFNPDELTEGERKALEMARNAEKRMHQATQSNSRQLENAVTENVSLDSGDPKYDELAQEVVNLKISSNVNAFWAANPEAREFEEAMAKTVQDKPWLANDLNDLYRVVRADPNREASLRKEGGKEALTQLAQKQQAVSPTSAANNGTTYATKSITPQNVFDQIDKHDQEWFEKNHDAINRAIAGKPAKQ